MRNVAHFLGDILRSDRGSSSGRLSSDDDLATAMTEAFERIASVLQRVRVDHRRLQFAFRAKRRELGQAFGRDPGLKVDALNPALGELLRGQPSLASRSQRRPCEPTRLGEPRRLRR